LILLPHLSAPRVKLMPFILTLAVLSTLSLISYYFKSSALLDFPVVMYTGFVVT
jgi:hypothetical protein